MNDSSHREYDTRAELVLVAFIIALFVVIDMGIRLVESSLSGNINHIRSIPELSNKINGKERSVLFIGNSLTNNAIDSELFVREIYRSIGDNINAVKITPDGTALWDWYYIYKNNFNKEKSPDVLIIGYAWGQLRDQIIPAPARLAGFFANMEDINELIGFGMDKTPDIMEFLFSKLSQVYVNREPIRNRIMDLLIYDFRDSTQYINAQRRKKHGDEEPVQDLQFTYNILTRLIELANERNTKVIVMAMPVINNYPIDPDIRIVLDLGQVNYLDYRSLQSIKADMFLDPMHLNKVGSKVFSRKLAGDMIRIFERPSSLSLDKKS